MRFDVSHWSHRDTWVTPCVICLGRNFAYDWPRSTQPAYGHPCAEHRHEKNWHFPRITSPNLGTSSALWCQVEASLHQRRCTLGLNPTWNHSNLGLSRTTFAKARDLISVCLFGNMAMILNRVDLVVRDVIMTSSCHVTCTSINKADDRLRVLLLILWLLLLLLLFLSLMRRKWKVGTMIDWPADRCW